MIFNKSECILFIKLSYFLFSCGSQLLKSRVNAVLELMRHISLLDLVKVKNFRIPELRLSFEDSQLSFPLLLHSGVCLWCSMWRWLPLKQIPWSSGFFRFYITWRWWSNFGSEQFENLFRVHFFFENHNKAAQETTVFSTWAESCSVPFSKESWKFSHD